jgi:hypothetical protein
VQAWRHETYDRIRVPHHNPGHRFVRSISCSGVNVRGPSATSRGASDSNAGSSQQSTTPNDLVQNTGVSGGLSLARRYRSPLSKFTTEQSRPDIPDTAMSTGVRLNTGTLAPETTTAPTTTGTSAAQPSSAKAKTRTDRIGQNRMPRTLSPKGKQTVGGSRAGPPRATIPGKCPFAPTSGRRYVPPP